MEFKIEGVDNLFRIKNISPITLLALQTSLDLNDLAKTEKFYAFVLEHIEVQLLDTWHVVKEPGREVYYPVDLEKDVNKLMSLITFFINNYLMPIFKKSNE